MDEMPGMIRPDLQALPQVKDRMTFLYLEHCKIHREDGAITAGAAAAFSAGRKSGASRPAGLPFDTTGLLQTEGNSGTIATGGTVLRDLFSLFPACAGVILG